MTDLKTTYMGINLKNPIIVGANHMVSHLDNLKRFEDSGAAAIVYKTLFEEQISLEKIKFHDEWSQYDERGAEMIHIHPNIEHSGPAEHLFNLSRAKAALGIPLIASLNCVYQETWLEYAKEISKTGVDGLEINFFAVPKDLQSDGSLIEDMRVNILKEIKKVITIPVSVKLSFFYTNPLNMVAKLSNVGADGFVIFNRLFEPEIDIEALVQTADPGEQIESRVLDQHIDHRQKHGHTENAWAGKSGGSSAETSELCQNDRSDSSVRQPFQAARAGRLQEL